MANTFVLIAQQPLEFKGTHYEPGDRFVAHAFEAAPYQRQLGLYALAVEQACSTSVDAFLVKI